ncbi:hypothetical protein IF188_09215 [Microbacterium sp. NEAU-LLC]|uniref:Uncharacterized protein n=1 Tax=Microbacterium helvum TaxID=2773713 RepID=A0ABR8NQ32_9MICO|nr:hypothetical protein [Microbacterium helvum]MBD3941872.1 hypothetical protein [Microbacterium helvum]
MNDRPREGIYLDATLAVIGEQVDERIDELTRRRGRRVRIGIATLAVATIASGAATAVALTSRAGEQEPAASAPLTVTREVHCVDRPDPGVAAYFTARYRTGDDVSVDDAALCASARSAIAADDGAIAQDSPAELVARALELVRSAATVDAAAPGTADGPAPAAVGVDEASFGLLSAGAGASFVVCAAGGDLNVVVSTRSAATNGVERAALCAAVDR